MTKKLTTRQVHQRILRMSDSLRERAATDDTFPPNEFHKFTFLRLAQAVHFGEEPYTVKRKFTTEREAQKGFEPSTLEAYMTTSEWAACYRAVHRMYKHGWSAVKEYIDERLRQCGMPTENFPVRSALDPATFGPDNVPDYPQPNRHKGTWANWHEYIRANSVYVGTMEALVGSVWRNRYTGSMETIAAFGYSRFGEPELFPYSDLTGVQKVLTAGFWRVPEFYFIEHDVRVDHLPYEQQLAWYTHEIGNVSAQVAKYRNDPDKWEREWHEKRLQAAQERRDAFMRAHGHEPTIETRNAGLVGQLSLF